VIYRVLMHVDISAHDDRHAHAQANALQEKLRELIRDPFAKMVLSAAGITFVGEDGSPVVYSPKPHRETG
jgi:hypothetical protein